MPLPVIGATLVYAVSFMIIAGLQIIMSRMLDARKTFVVGVSVIAGISVFSLGHIYSEIHLWVKPVFSSALSLATITAIVLNLIMRIGTKKHVVLGVSLKGTFSDKIFEFMDYNGKRWGARPEIIFNVGAALNEFMDIAAGYGFVIDKDLKVNVYFDEFSLDATICYRGQLIQFPDKRPSPDEIMGIKTAP
ncbi:MAG: hypothetical protein B6D64_10755 [Bacteroidetes bacterium 4484_276]|nr:MAG: hypothetical protein B6D64_10755 [Bacteroidetes bacterium 4484_276]